MSDLYSELLVKKEITGADKFRKFGSIALTVVAVLAGLLIHPLILIAALAIGIASYTWVIPNTDLEFEYLYVNGDLDIDKIMAKTKRKKVKSLKIQDAELIAPLNSHRMDYYNGNQNLKVYDFSSGNPDHKRFAVITRDGSETCKVIIEPDEDLANKMRNTAPSKVFLD